MEEIFRLYTRQNDKTLLELGKEFNAEYIATNPSRWAEDRFHT